MRALPYSDATSGKAALDEARKILAGFGASSFGSMDDFAAGTLTVQFVYHGIPVTVTASSKGYAAAMMRRQPWNSRMRRSPKEYEMACVKQGQIAVCSILRDWIKGQVTAVECGILSFQGAFLGQIMLPTGETVLQRLSAPETPVALPMLEAPK